MKKLIIPAVLAVIFAVPLIVLAQSTVTQGNGSTSVVEWRVNVSANRAGDTTEVCVTNAAGGTTITNLTSRKAIELQNLNAANAIYCTVDGGAPVVGSHGRKVATDSAWSLDAGPAVTVKCISAAAAQVSPSCTMVTQLR